MIIRHNIAGINTNRNKGIAQRNMKKKLEKLSSGYRINRSGDDAAGLAISESMRSHIRGLNQAMDNCSDGINMASTGEGALTEVHSMMQRLKTLAVQSANGTYTSTARENLDAERLQLLDELDRIGGHTNFDGIPLFDDASTVDPPFALPEAARKKDENGNAIVVGTDASGNDVYDGEAITLQVGHSQSETLDVTRYYMSSKALGLTDWEDGKNTGTDFTTVESANKSIKVIEDAIEAISDIRANFGAAQNHLEHTFANLSVTSENMTEAESQIRDAKMAEEFVDYTKENIFYQSSNAMAAQANTTVERILSLLQ